MNSTNRSIPSRRGRLVRRLARTAAFALVRGVAAAAGSSAVALAVWWLQAR
ncbi:hypothetical protein OG589_41530 [Sphaerisporangium sp. NBC_01403]|uniref:hypothetical protein n=1 Tax=Sphaerisporangium sp. NBC_01403 TaxID=2903599 RepID=UPI003248F3C8